MPIIKKLLVLLFFIPFVAVACGIDGFASDLSLAMKNRDVKGLKNIMDGTVIFSDEDAEEVFQGYSAFFISDKDIKFSLLSSIDLTASYSEKQDNVLIFYKGKLPSVLTWNFVENAWGESILALEVRYVNGKWRIVGTPFFIYRHAPWASDYG